MEMAKPMRPLRVALLPELIRYAIDRQGMTKLDSASYQERDVKSPDALAAWYVFDTIVIAITAHFSGSRKIQLCERVCRTYKSGESMACLLMAAFGFALVGVISVRIHDAVTSGLLGPS